MIPINIRSVGQVQRLSLFSYVGNGCICVLQTYNLVLCCCRKFEEDLQLAKAISSSLAETEGGSLPRKQGINETGTSKAGKKGKKTRWGNSAYIVD